LGPGRLGRKQRQEKGLAPEVGCRPTTSVRGVPPNKKEPPVKEGREDRNRRPVRGKPRETEERRLLRPTQRSGFKKEKRTTKTERRRTLKGALPRCRGRRIQAERGGPGVEEGGGNSLRPLSRKPVRTEPGARKLKGLIS